MADHSVSRGIAKYQPECIDKFVEEHQLRRLQCYVECDFSEAIRMVQHLGFEWEFTMENFVGDKSAYLYKRII